MVALALLALVVACAPAATPTPTQVSLVFWTQESEAERTYQEIQLLTKRFMGENPNVTIELVQKSTETLREDFQTASLAGEPPDLLWTVNDHAGPFTTANLIQPVDDLVDLTQYVDSALAAVELQGKHWGIPISNGNHLMLLYNKDLVPEPPENTDALISLCQGLAGQVEACLAFNQTEPFWLVPWLGGFGGRVFAEDGVTPTLNTPEMVATLEFLHSLKYDYEGILPAESDYAGADTLFKEGRAAMLINGDWSLGDYATAMGDKLGVARIPKVSETDLWPAPYTSGKYFMFRIGLEGAELQAALDFATFVTSEVVQLEWANQFRRLPGLKAALDEPIISEDPILSGSADQMVVGTPMPTVVEMRCNWDAMKPEMIAVLTGVKTPEDAAAAMQPAAEACIATLE
jgi:arabinogalactan oligomer/maltooligosaccharide transport system substrate-binding protein